MARIRYSSGRCPVVPDFSQAYWFQYIGTAAFHTLPQRSVFGWTAYPLVAPELHKVPPLLTDCKRLQYLRGNRQPRSWPLTDSGRHASQVQTECRPTDDLQQPEAAYISSEPPHIQRSHAPVYTGTDFCWLCKKYFKIKDNWMKQLMIQKRHVLILMNHFCPLKKQ